MAERKSSQTPASEAGARREHRPLGGLLWLALLVCFSPVLVDLAQHLAAEPWALYVLAFPPLLVHCALRERPDPPSLRVGAALLAIGLAIELVAVGGGLVRLGRLGLPLAVIGMSRAFGLLSPRAALLSLWWVPLPSLVISFSSPALETAWLHLVAWPLGLVGADVAVETGLLRIGALELALAEADGGLPLAALLSGLGWYASARLGEPLSRCARRAARWAVLAFPLQIAFLGLAVIGIVIGVPNGPVQVFLRFLWIPVAVTSFLLFEAQLLAKGSES